MALYTRVRISEEVMSEMLSHDSFGKRQLLHHVAALAVEIGCKDLYVVAKHMLENMGKYTVDESRV